MSHHDNCICPDCIAWYALMQRASATGRCKGCNAPIDDHPKDKDGTIEGCPARAHA